jgi:hypothetical protein
MFFVTVVQEVSKQYAILYRADLSSPVSLFWDGILGCNSGCPQTHKTSVSASQELELLLCATMLGTANLKAKHNAFQCLREKDCK